MCHNLTNMCKVYNLNKENISDDNYNSLIKSMVDTCALTVIGDGVVGKTTLLMRYVDKIVPNVGIYIPTIFENICKDVFIDGNIINLQLWDTAGQEEYDKVRKLAYLKTDVFLICYAVNNPISLENVINLWRPEIKSCQIPYLLIGTKIDLVEDVNKSIKEGLAVSKKIKAEAFMVCSSLTGVNVDEIFEKAIRIFIKKRSKRKCIIV